MILILAEHAEGKLAKTASELTHAARSLHREGPITLLVLGSSVAAIATQAALIADQVLVADTPALAAYDPELYAAALAQIAREGDAHTILLAGTRAGRETSPRLAVKLDAPLLEDVVTLTDESGTLIAQHYTFLARVTETIAAQAPTIVVTVKPGAFPPPPPTPSPPSNTT